jgi:hypothetical protein
MSLGLYKDVFPIKEPGEKEKMKAGEKKKTEK